MPTKLTKDTRAQFVRNVLADIKTKVDDDALRKLVTDEAVARLPQKVKALWVDAETRPFVNVQPLHFTGHNRANRTELGLPDIHKYQNYLYCPSIAVPAETGYKPSAKVLAQIAKALADQDARELAKERMQKRLESMSATCKTVEALEAMFPELAKYIPTPVARVPDAGVPAVMVKDFMKELRKLGVPAPKAVAA